MTLAAKILSIRSSGASIFTPFEATEPECVLSDAELEALFWSTLVGTTGYDLPQRSRSKLAKERVCAAMGYPVPKSFKKVRPRLPAQDLDVLVQLNDNVQIWNEEIVADRRYLLIRPNDAGMVVAVRVVRGRTLIDLDTTGRLTHKEQARISGRSSELEIVNLRDTPTLAGLCGKGVALAADEAPTDAPAAGRVMAIRELALRLMDLPGMCFADPGSERGRGDALHRMVAGLLGYAAVADTGGFPDVAHQALEVKLQTSDTIDLGALDPASGVAVPGFLAAGIDLAPRDCRYLVVLGQAEAGTIRLTKVILVSGERFFERFPRCANGGNMKYQMPLPAGFFFPAT